MATRAFAFKFLTTLSLTLLLVLLATLVPGTGALISSAAQEPGIYAEDGRLIPLPRPPGEAVHVAAQQSVAPTGPGVLVRRVADVSPEAFAATLHEAGFAEAQGLLAPQWWRVSVSEGQTVDQVLATIRTLPGVEVAEEDQRVMLAGEPNDAQYAQEQWGPQKAQAPLAWDTTLGSEDVWIAVVDTGIDYEHEDRPANLWLGYDFANNDDDPRDDNAHGTHVAGIAAARTNNDVGVAGMCSGCGVMPIKVLDANGSGSQSAIANGIRQAADAGEHFGKRMVINLSLGGGYSRVIEEAVGYALSKGALIVAAAGNSGAGGASYPAALDGVLSVSATDGADHPARFSQYGLLAAPGVDILSTVPGGGYRAMSGTSMASPLVAGAAGLVWSQFPEYTAAQVMAALTKRADMPTDWDDQYGTGRLNVASALETSAE
ncbi:MAG: S8 family serine peptidase [Anaerolineae bacterium]